MTPDEVRAALDPHELEDEVAPHGVNTDDEKAVADEQLEDTD